MESIKCSAKDTDIYIFLAAGSALELADLNHGYSSKDLLRLSMGTVPPADPHHP